MTEYEYTDQDGDTLKIKPSNGEPGTAYLCGPSVYVPADDVEEVCAALREAAGLPPVSTVEKAEIPVSLLNSEGRIEPFIDYPLAPSGARQYAAMLLAAADEAEARANRPTLPTAADSVIKVEDKVWVRGEDYWQPSGSSVRLVDKNMAALAFTVLYDPEKTT